MLNHQTPTYPPSNCSKDLDPLSIITAPPLGETVTERAKREAKEAEEKRVSDLIDEALKQDKSVYMSERSAIKVLLLGQSESGKSTTLKSELILFTSVDLHR